jgi:hypothetical protein
MRVMVLVKATGESEKGTLPSAELLGAMGKFNVELVSAGILRAGEGLKPSSAGKRVAFDGSGPRSVTGLSPRQANWSPASGCGRSRIWTRRLRG